MASGAIADLQGQLDQAVSDPSLDPAARVKQLRGLRSDIATLLGQADRYMADLEKQREGEAIDRVAGYIRAREDADLRGDLVDRAQAAPEALDAAGLLSHNELDRRLADGTFEEAVLARQEPLDDEPRIDPMLRDLVEEDPALWDAVVELEEDERHEPPNLRDATKATERCAVCSMFDPERGCWGYGYWKVRPDQVCDSFDLSENWEKQKAEVEGDG
jgi:hypothetical protein